MRDLDMRALDRETASQRREAERRNAERGLPHPDAVFDGMLEAVSIAAWAERRPPADAAVVIRARMPPGGGHGSDHRSVVWREADGSWWFWRHSVNNGPPQPPPMPPVEMDPGSAEGRAWSAAQQAGRSEEERYWPPVEGQLSAGQTAQIEAAWADPCRSWDPESWPHELPLNRRIDGSRRRLCAQDSSAIFGDIAETARPRRRVGGACINGSPTYRMIAIAVYATSDP